MSRWFWSLSDIARDASVKFSGMSERITGEGYQWKTTSEGGLLTVRRMAGRKVIVLK
ncbi:MAG: hypothetical protein WB699_12630 [Bacteroidota bacterium]